MVQTIAFSGLSFPQKPRWLFNCGLDDRRPKAIVCPTALKTDKERRRRSAAISRKLQMLRAHGLIRKRPRSHRYDVSPNGRLILNAILSAQNHHLASAA